MAACTAFESAAHDALGVGIGNRVKDNLNDALARRGLSVDWGKGTWQRLAAVYQLRVDYVHRYLDQARLFAAVTEAVEAIATVRAAVKDLFAILGLPVPAWVDTDDDLNVARECVRVTDHANLTSIEAGAKSGDPDVIRVVYVFKAEEHESCVLPPGSDHLPAMAVLEKGIAVPITAIRAYRGTTLIEERTLRMRGS